MACWAVQDSGSGTYADVVIVQARRVLNVQRFLVAFPRVACQGR